MEGRHWLWQFSQSLVGIEEIEARFGQDIAEAFQMWVALQKDMEMEVKNAADCLREESRASSSDTATVPVEVPGGELSSVEGAEVARVMDEGTAAHTTAETGMEHNAMQEVAGVEGASEDNGFRPGVEGVACEVEATMPDSLQDDESALRAGLGDALRGLMPEDEMVGGDEVAGHDGNGGGTGRSEQGDEREVHAARNTEAHEEENTEEGHAMDVDGGEPYVVPPAWARVLRAWNDPAIGAGFPDSVLSCGDFQHGAIDDELERGCEAGTAGIATEAASSGATTSSTRASTEGPAVLRRSVTRRYLERGYPSAVLRMCRLVHRHTRVALLR